MKLLRLMIAISLAPVLLSHGYVLNYSPSGVYQHWALLNLNLNVPTNSVNRNTHAIRYYLASDGYSATNTTAELNALRASFGQWLAITNTHLKFEEVGLVNPPVDVNTGDNSNILYWAKSSTIVKGGTASISGALGVTFVTFFSDGALSQADIVFNGVEDTWFTSVTNTSNPGFIVEGVALHEMGHFIGLRHSPVGGASMLYAGSSGISLQTGLSADDVAAARFIYPLVSTNYGSIKGTVTRDGSPLFGAAVYVQDSATNIIAGTVSLTNGTYHVGSLPSGTYYVRVAPLDPTGLAESLVSGNEIGAPAFSAADPNFLPSTNISATVAANATNTVDFAVVNSPPAFRITEIRKPTSNPGSYSWSGLGAAMRVGQSNYVIGVASPDLPTSGATLSITGDGLTLGAATFNPNAFSTGLNFISIPISVSSNATPGLRSFVVTQGADIAYANGYLDIQPAVTDDNFDGVDDIFQRTYFPVFTSTNAAPGADPDGDGYNNHAESISGTNPTNAASYLKIQSVTRDAGGATVVWQSGIGKKYQVSTRTNMTTAAWQNIGSPVTANATTAQYLDAAATNSARFYRIQALP